MAILKKLNPIIFLPLLSSCEEVFTPDAPHTPVLCINSLITAGEHIESVVSKSRLYTDSPDRSEVNDGEVRIYANGELQLDSYIPQEGDEVRIVAESISIGRCEGCV